MMEHDKALRLQAWLDGELPEAERRAVSEWLDRDPEARALCQSLAAVRKLLSGNEHELKLPESREFYWSKIARAIESPAAAKAARPRRDRLSWWRLIVPVGAAALLAAGLAWRVVLNLASDPGYLAVGQEIETPVEGMDSFTFRSESARMTVVWLGNYQIN